MKSTSAITTSSILLALLALISAPSMSNGQVGVALFGGENSTDITDDDDGCKSITEILCNSDDEGRNLVALCEAVGISGLNDDLSEDEWTIFAPTDEAFLKLGRDNLDALVFGNDTVPLTDLLLFHIIPGVALTSDLLPCEAGNNLIEMANGEDSRTLCTGKTTPVSQRGFFNDRDVSPAFIETDIEACNGVIHILDKVMLDVVLPFGIPDPAAPESESSDEPDPVLVQTSGNGNDADPDCQTIADLACSNSDFSILCTLVTENGLADDLSEGSWTVFAPTNDAFESAPRFPEGTDFVRLLLGHVVDSVVGSADLGCTERITMANGKDTRTQCEGASMYQKGKGNSDVQRPEIIDSDIEACNGVMHVVDQVILSFVFN